MSITWQKITTLEQLSALREQWSVLNQRSNNNCIFTSPTWLLNWYGIYWQKNWQLHSFAVFKENKLIAFFPFYFQTTSTFLLQQRLFFLGQGESEKAEIASEYLDILIKTSEQDSILNMCNDYIQLNKFDLFTIRAIKQDSNIANLLSDHKQLIGYQYCINKNDWCISNLSKNNKSRYKRSKNQLTKLDAKFVWAKQEDYSYFWQKMKQFHQQRWQNKQQAGAFSESEFNKFHQQLFEQHDHDSISVKMSLIKIGDCIIAINYYLLSNDTLHFYQSGWDEIEYSQLSPGFALHLWSIENSSEDKYDFMLGGINDSYKAKFRTSKEPLYSIEINSKPIKSLFLKVLQKLTSN